jgi:ATP-dependent RNA helicase DeaD
LQRYLPDRKLNSCMFSATFPYHVMRTAREFMTDPEFLSLSSDHVHVTDVEHVYYHVPDMGRERNLVRIIEVENPTSAIIFCNTKVDVHFLAVVLQRFGYDADELSADLSQNDRERVLQRVREGKLRFLVATDVAGRGIDIPELSHVFQYEPPEDIESYIHRSGRTGRAGSTGTAVMLVRMMDRPAVARIAKQYDIEMREVPLPTDEDVESVVTERLTTLLEARLRDRDNLQAERSRRFIPLARSLGENEDESAIMAMLLDDYYQQMLHAPVAGPAETAASKPKQQSSQSRSGGNGRSGGGNRNRSRRRSD